MSMGVEYLKQTGDGSTQDRVQTVPISPGSLTLDPFANTRDSRFYYGSASHEAALARLRAALLDGNQGWASLSSGPGLGKTMLRTVLHRGLDPLLHVGISIETSLLNFDELLMEIISQLSGERVQGSAFPDRYSRLSEFKFLLTERLVHSGRRLVLLVDEAQGLDRETLEGLRNLSNICAEQCNLMSFVLIGGCQLESTLRGLPELAQRIPVRTSLRPLDATETGEYLQHRLITAGSRQPFPFSENDMQKLHQATGGVPRRINDTLKQAVYMAKASGTGLGTASLRQALDDSPGSDASRNIEFQNLGMS
jgi:type II secretory pathway predicted ATPase ExeA